MAKPLLMRRALSSWLAIGLEQLRDTDVPLSLRANFSWAFLGHAIYALCQWAILTVLVKLGTPATVGHYSMGLALTAPILMLANLQLRQIQMTDKVNEFPFGEYLRLRLCTSAASLILIVFLVALGRYETAARGTILLVGAAKVLEAISDIHHGAMQQQERTDRVATSLIAKGLLSLVIATLVMALTRSVLWSSLGITLSWAAVLIFFDRPTTLKMVGLSTKHIRHDKQRTVDLAVLALPLGIVAMLSSLTVTIPRLQIQTYLGEASLGIFTGLAYLQTAGQMLLSALSQAITPRVALYYGENRIERLARLLRVGMLAGLVVGLLFVLLAVFFGPPILSFIYTSEYASHHTAFIVLSVSSLLSFIAMPFGAFLTAARLLREQVFVFICVVFSVWIVGMLLIPRYQLVGAAFASLLGAAVQITLGGTLIWARLLRPTARVRSTRSQTG